jgi:hypothetical protein
MNRDVERIQDAVHCFRLNLREQASRTNQVDDLSQTLMWFTRAERICKRSESSLNINSKPCQCQVRIFVY